VSIMEWGFLSLAHRLLWQCHDVPQGEHPDQIHGVDCSSAHERDRSLVSLE